MSIENLGDIFKFVGGLGLFLYGICRYFFAVIPEGRNRESVVFNQRILCKNTDSIF